MIINKQVINKLKNAKNVGIAKNVDIRNGDVVNDVIPSIAKLINFA